MISNGNLHAMAFSYFVDVDEVRTADADSLCRTDVPWRRAL